MGVGNSFAEALYQFLAQDLEKRKKEEGWDGRFDPQFSRFEADFCDRKMALDELFAKFQFLFAERGPIHIERKLLHLLPGLVIPRAVPRLYDLQNPSRSRFLFPLPPFATLVRLAAEKRYLPLFQHYRPLDKKRVAVRGKEGAEKGEIMRIISEKFPQVALVEEGEEIALHLERPLFGEKKDDLFLGLYRPQEIPSLGLNFLEKGVLIPPRKLAPLPPLVRAFAERPGHFFTAALGTEEGAMLYLDIILSSLKEDKEPISIALLEGRHLLSLFSLRLERGEPLLDPSFGISSIELQVEGQKASFLLSEKGKALSLFVLDSSPNFYTLASLSSPLVAVHSATTLLEALLAGKIPFYDAPKEGRHFLLDLLAFSLPHLRGIAKSYLSLFQELLSHTLYPEEGVAPPWVEEIYFLEKRPFSLLRAEFMKQIALPTLAQELSSLLLLLEEKGSAEPYVEQRVAKALFDLDRPSFRAEEEAEWRRFVTEGQSFSSLIGSIMRLLSRR